MAAIRTWVIGIVAWGAVAASATAAPMSWFGSQDELTAWYANQIHSAGNIYAPSSSTLLSNFPTSWHGPSPASGGAVMEALSASAPAPQGVPFSSVASYSASSNVKSEANWNHDPQGQLTTVDVKSVVAPPPPPAKPFVNFGSEPYAELESLTVGTAAPWYNSPSVTKVFGGVPDEARRTDFVQSVLANVEDTFRLSGLDVKFGDAPESPASSMISVASGLSYKEDKEGNVAGITYVGSDGFSFIDKLNGAKSPEELALVLGHNVAHELMHSLGVAKHPETTEYLDGERGGWDLMTNPNTRFSPEAVALMAPSLERMSDQGVTGEKAAQLLSEDEQVAMAPDFTTIAGSEAPVPEPSTIAVWTISGLFAGFTIRRRSVRKNAA